MKRICYGCDVAAQERGMHDCLFCRTPLPCDSSSALALVQKRVDVKDPDAIKSLGDNYSYGECGLEMNISRAVDLWTEAAALGSSGAHYYSLGSH